MQLIQQDTGKQQEEAIQLLEVVDKVRNLSYNGLFNFRLVGIICGSQHSAQATVNVCRNAVLKEENISSPVEGRLNSILLQGGTRRTVHKTLCLGCSFVQTL